MRNVTTEINGKKLIITCDISEPGTPSASGKSMVVASTGGNIQVPGTADEKSGVLLKLGLNLYR